MVSITVAVNIRNSLVFPRFQADFDNSAPFHQQFVTRAPATKRTPLTNINDTLQSLSFPKIDPGTVRFASNNHDDYFSATWWQTKERFLKSLSPELIQSVEGAVFSMIHPRVHQDLRMTADWLGFSVEHLSKAWKITGVEQGPEETAAYNMFVDKLLRYTSRTLLSTGGSSSENPNDSTTSMTSQAASPSSSSSAMPLTIALIAFMPYHSKLNATRGQALTVANLAATLTSLIRVHCGRIVVVLDEKDYGNPYTPPIFTATKHLLLIHDDSTNITNQDRFFLERYLNITKSATIGADNPLASNWEFRVKNTEIAVATLKLSESDGTLFDDDLRLVPKAALLGLQKAFHNDSLALSQHWFGKHGSDYWKYVYLTEPDTILQAKDHVLVALSRELDQGKIASPHRLQPIPHQRDLPDIRKSNRALPNQGTFSNIVEMGTADKCCDGGQHHPGREEGFPHCGNFWWICGFSRRKPLAGNHSRLVPYQFMSLSASGTGIVSLAGSEHGRRCIPKTTDMPDYATAC